VNTSESVYKKVTPLSELSEEEAVSVERYREPRPEDSRPTATTAVFDDAECLDEEGVEITQRLAVDDWWAVIEGGGRFRAEPLESLLVSSDGGIVAVDEHDEDVSEREGFVGFVIADGRGMLRSERVQELLEETKIQEVK